MVGRQVRSVQGRTASPDSSIPPLAINITAICSIGMRASSSPFGTTEGRCGGEGTPARLGSLFLGLLCTKLIKGLGEGLGDLGGIAIFNLVPMQHEHRLTCSEQGYRG